MSKKNRSTTVETVAGIKIRYRPDRERYFIQIRREGLRHTESFASLDAARLKCNQLHREQTQHGLTAFELDRKTRADASEAVKLLNGRATLSDAARLWLLHNPDGGAVTVQDVVNQYMDELGRRKSRPLTLQDARTRLTRFVVDYGDHPATAITPENVSDWLTIRGGNPVNSNNSRKWLNSTFAFAMKRKVIPSNPVALVDPTPVDAKLPDHWGAERVEGLLRAAQAFNPDVIPVFAVMAFAGLRPHEAARMNWQDVNLSEGIIRVLPGTSKVRQSRVVEISKNLALWLAPHREKAGPIAPAQVTINRWRVRLSAASILGVEEVRRRITGHKGKSGTAIKSEGLGWRAIIRDAKTQANAPLWPHDILRHSMATAWLAVHSDIFRLSEMLGNSPDVIRRHYKGLMTRKEGKAYFDITPEKEGRIIRLAKSA